jgi:prepilin-type N-terminal cleavage/methylation domain-containing protein
MNVSTPIRLREPRVGRRAIPAFTLAELLVAMAIFSMLVAGTVASQIFGLRLYRIADAKLAVAADARRVMNSVRNEIWSGKLLYVGTGDQATFNLIADNLPHMGNALRICATTDTNSYVYYFRDANDNCLKRMISGNGTVQVIAQNVTNEVVFRAEDFQGNTVSNYLNNRAINVALQIRRPEWNGTMFEYFQLQTRIARRALE